MKAPPMTPALHRVLVEEEPAPMGAAAELLDAVAAVALHSHAATEELLRAHSQTLMRWVRQYGGSEDALGYALVAFTEAMHLTLASGIPLSTALQSTLSAQRWTVDRETPNTNLSAPAGVWRRYRASMRSAGGNPVLAEEEAAARKLSPVVFRRLRAAANPVALGLADGLDADRIEPSVPDEDVLLSAEILLDRLTEPQRAVIEEWCGFVDQRHPTASGYRSDQAVAQSLHLPVATVADLRSSALRVMYEYATQILEDDES